MRSVDQPAASGQSLPGARVVVTGGTRGIGAGIACTFLRSGAQVLVCGRRAPAALPAVDGTEAVFPQADVRDPEQARRLIATAAERFGGVDVVVSNAGGSPEAEAATASPRFHAKIIELNLIAPLHVAQAANEVMQAQPGGGSVIMIGSVSGSRPSPGTAAYGAAISATVPLGRMATPGDVAAACLFLASPQAAYVSGACLTLHGGGERPAFHSVRPPGRPG
jgi:NAD(P)-dependent dehydrogenase (short-subunit alcohol dehydrogenase family)